MLIKRLRLYSIKNISQHLRDTVTIDRNSDNQAALLIVIVGSFIINLIFAIQFLLVPAEYLSKNQILLYLCLFISMTALSALLFPFVIFKRKGHSRTLLMVSEFYFFFFLTWSLLVSLLDIKVNQGYAVFIIGIIIYTIVHRASLKALVVTILWLLLAITLAFTSPFLNGIEIADMLPFYLYVVVAVLTSVFTETTRIEASLIREELRNSNDELRNLSILDPLTGAYNRRYLTEYLSHHIPFARRLTLNFSVLLLDLDKFKNINDQFGHLEGDRVLIKTVDVLRNSLREYDLVFRYGGEEFLIVLINTAMEEAIILAERVRGELENTDFGLNGRLVTASIGIACFPQDGGMDSLLDAADTRVYDAKTAGRNLCVSR